MNNQAKIAELKKNINNKFFPEALKPKLLAQIEKLEEEDKASENKGILPHPKPKQSKTSIAKIDGMPKFVIGDIVVLKGETTLEKEIIDRRMNNKNQYVYKAKYVSKPSETGEWNENELELFNSNNVDYNKMSDADFAFTTLGKIVAADKKAWDETKADSGSEIRNSEKLTKLYATSLEKSLKDLKVKKNSLTEKEYDYLVDNNYHLLNEFLFWNDFYENDLAKGQKEMYQRLFADKNNHSSTANPDWITIGKTSTTKILPKSIEILYAEGTISEYDKFPKAYPSFEAANKALIPVYKNVYKDTDENDENDENVGYNKTAFKIVWTDGEEYEGRLDIGKHDNPTKTKNLIGDHMLEFLQESIEEPQRYDTTPTSEYQRLLDNYMFSGAIADSGKGILPHPKPKQSKTSIATKEGEPKFVIGNIVTSLKGTNKATVIDRNMNNKNQYVYKVKNVGNGVEHEELESDLLLFEMEEVSFKPKKPTVARTVKSELKKYYAHREIKTVTVIEDGKKVVYKGEDVLNGAQFLAKGGKVEEIATYYPIRAIVEVTLDNGEKVKPANGYHIKNGAKPIAELGAALATDEIINNSIVDYHNPRFSYEEGGKIDDVIMEVEQIVDIALDNKIIASNLTFYQFSEEIFDKSKISFGKSYLKLAYDSLKDVNYAQGGLTSGSGDFDYIKFLDFVQPKVEATLLENNVTLLNDYTVVHEGEEFEPVIIYKGIGGKANALSVGYFADNDPQLKLLLSIDFELEEMEYHIRSKGWDIDDVDMYAKGGWVKDHKYLNKSEAYEMRYAKGKNRKGYMEKGGEVFDYKNQYDKTKIKSIADVEAFFNYLYDVEKISFHPDDEFLGNMNDDYTKKQAINLDRYMLDCFDVCEKEKKDIYGIAANPMLLKPHLVFGRKAKGVSVKKIADMHNVTEKYLRKQLQRGQKVELEHTTNEAVAYAIAKDHLYENPDYYILLQQIEMKADGGEIKTNKFKLNDILVPEKDGDYSEEHWKVTFLDLPTNTIKVTKYVNGKLKDEYTSSVNTYDNQFRLANQEEISDLNKILEKETSEYAKGGKLANKGILPHPKPKRQGSQIFAKAAEIRLPNEKWTDAVKRASLQLKK